MSEEAGLTMRTRRDDFSMLNQGETLKGFSRFVGYATYYVCCVYRSILPPPRLSVFRPGHLQVSTATEPALGELLIIMDSGEPSPANIGHSTC